MKCHLHEIKKSHSYSKQLYLWVICYHYSYQKIIVQIRELGLWYLRLICEVFSVPSVTALNMWHTEPLRQGWMYLLCQYGALSLTVSFELFGYSICLNSSTEFCPLPIQYFSTCSICLSQLWIGKYTMECCPVRLLYIKTRSWQLFL